MRIGALTLAAAVFGSTVLVAATVRRVRPTAITIGQKTFVLHEYGHSEIRARQRIHEAVHRLQYRNRGLAGFIVRYALDSRQRLAWEAEALAAELCFVRVSNPERLPQLIDAQAAMLQRYGVTRPVSRKNAIAHMRRAFRAGRACDRFGPVVRSAGATVRATGPGTAAAPP